MTAGSSHAVFWGSAFRVLRELGACKDSLTQSDEFRLDLRHYRPKWSMREWERELVVAGLNGLAGPQSEWTLGLGEAAHLLHVVQSVCTG